MTKLETKRIEVKRQILKDYLAKTNPMALFAPQEYQVPFWACDKKNVNVLGGNRSGKTELGAAALVDRCLSNPNYDTWAATWADLSIPIQQTKINRLLPKNKLVKYAKFTEQRGFANRIIIFENGSIIRFKTYDQGRESFQGAAKDLIWLDEEPPQSIVSECNARLIDRNGVLMRTMTPLNGITYTYDEVIINEKNDPEIIYWFWDSSMNKYTDQQALERVINSYAEKEAEVRKTGHFLNLTTGVAYYAFGEDNILDEFDFGSMRTLDNEFRYMENRPLEVSCDFNVDLMSWSIGQEYQTCDIDFDYIELERHANTELMCQTLKNKYPFHQGGFIFYGDIAGNQRHPEAARTNWAIIKDEFPNAQIHYQNIRNIKDRIDATNARIKNKRGDVRAFVTRNCKRLLKDLRRVTWEHLLNKNKDKEELLTHSSDGYSYKMFWKYPLTGNTESRQY